ncbi:hypothetical protein U9M48_010307 [Paspalum notatum var. saurae]|uniref:Uncharacterized protein n=1 Tax=Paspalum notatum var. saurae TaxID=547442 RepID=A0AAQ3STG3_PASNO
MSIFQAQRFLDDKTIMILNLMLYRASYPKFVFRSNKCCSLMDFDKASLFTTKAEVDRSTLMQKSRESSRT